MQSVKEGLVVMVVLMFEVTLLVALAMRHLAVMFSLGESKRDTRGVMEMATEAHAFTIFIFIIILIVLFLCHQPLRRSLLGEVVLVGEGLGFVFLDQLATIVFSLLVRALHNKLSHIATVEASSNLLLALDAT